VHCLLIIRKTVADFNTVMSTFKEQPVYAQTVFDWLNSTFYPDAPYSPRDVAHAVSWVFSGGSFKTDGEPTEHSGDTYPHGNLADMVDESGNVLGPLRTVLTRARLDRRMTPRTRREKLAGLHVALHLQEHRYRGALYHSGARATYALVRYLLQSVSLDAGKNWWRNMFQFMRETEVAGAAASMLDVPTMNERVEELKRVSMSLSCHQIDKCRRTADMLAHTARGMLARRHARSVGSKLFRGEEVSAREASGVKFEEGDAKFHVTLNCIIFEFDQVPYVLSASDISRARTMLRGYSSGLFATVSQAIFAPGPCREQATSIGRAYIGQMNLVLDAVDHVPPQREVLVCKAMKRAYGAYLGELAGPLCSEETKELWNEVRDTWPPIMSHAIRYVEALRRWDKFTAFNLGKLYKLCPCPDSSPASTMLERYAMLTRGNVMRSEYVEQFKTEHRAQVLRAYIAAPGVRLELRDPHAVPEWMGSYRRGDFDSVPSGEIHQYLAWEGTAAMPDRTPLNPRCWKDSGLGWDTWDIAVDPDRNPRHGCMLTRMIFDKDCPMPGVRYTQAVHYHKEEQKPEGHKDPERAIFSANLMDRLIQSWMEEAVYRVFRNHPSYMIGANIATRDAKVSVLVQRNLKHDEVDVYYSFDIKGWSPLMPAHVQRISHSTWAELYDDDLFRDAHKINEMSTVYMNKRGYQGWYINPGANFEGYNAKEMTVILITLMSMSVAKWRARVVEAGILGAPEAARLSAMLMAYIDDGLAKATLPLEHAVRLFDEWKKSTVEVFTGCGFALEVNKCYPSDRFAIFLNEVYYMGRTIAHGTRAAMTMCSEQVDEKISLLEQVTAIATAARGAVVAGLDATAAHCLMSYHLWPKMRQYLGRTDPIAAAVWCVTPANWGGLGIPSVLQLATSGGGAATEESAYHLQSYARYSPAALAVFRSVTERGYSTRTKRGILTAPLGGKVHRGTMRVDWISGAVRERLGQLSTDGELSSLARDVLGMSEETHFAELCDDLLSETRVIQEQVLDDVYKSLPHSVFSAFCARIEKGTTLRTLIGARKLNEIRRNEKIDTIHSYEILRSRITSSYVA
jgi:hypothetical protein